MEEILAQKLNQQVTSSGNFAFIQVGIEQCHLDFIK